MKPRLYYHRNCIAFGIGGERVGIYDEVTDMRYMIIHFKVDFLFWHLHWDFRTSRKTKLNP